MGKQQYNKDFKIQICKAIEANATTVGKAAKEYAISRPIVSRWLAEYKKYGNKAFSGKGNRLPDQAKLYALESEIERLKTENEILKKFAAFVKQKNQ